MALNYTHFADNLRKIRKEKGLTQKELADLLGVSKRTIINYESQDSAPSDRILEKIVTTLDISLEEILGYLRNEDFEKKIELLQQLNFMEEKGSFERHDLEDSLLSLINEKASFKKMIEGFSEEGIDRLLDNKLGGKINKTAEEKINLINADFDGRIQQTILDLEENYKNGMIMFSPMIPHSK